MLHRRLTYTADTSWSCRMTRRLPHSLRRTRVERPSVALRCMPSARRYMHSVGSIHRDQLIRLAATTAPHAKCYHERMTHAAVLAHQHAPNARFQPLDVPLSRCLQSRTRWRPICCRVPLRLLRRRPQLCMGPRKTRRCMHTLYLDHGSALLSGRTARSPRCSRATKF